MNYPVHFSDDPGEQRRQWHRLLDDVDREIADERAEAQLFETDIGKVLDETPSPFVVDRGMHTSRADRDAIQAEQDRWTRWERMGR